MRIFFVDDFSLALYNKLYGMKANISLVILFIVGFNNNLKAQWNDYSFYYNKYLWSAEAQTLAILLYVGEIMAWKNSLSFFRRSCNNP